MTELSAQRLGRLARMLTLWALFTTIPKQSIAAPLPNKAIAVMWMSFVYSIEKRQNNEMGIWFGRKFVTFLMQLFVSLDLPSISSTIYARIFLYETSFRQLFSRYMYVKKRRSYVSYVYVDEIDTWTFESDIWYCKQNILFLFSFLTWSSFLTL